MNLTKGLQVLEDSKESSIRLSSLWLKGLSLWLTIFYQINDVQLLTLSFIS